MEYFCNEGDALWTRPDQDFVKFAVEELASIGVLDPADVLDTTVLRVQKAYPGLLRHLRPVRPRARISLTASRTSS